jgi:transposase InsO family protein
VILDLYSRKCIGWELSRNIDSQLAMNALDKAIENRWSESTHEFGLLAILCGSQGKPL